MDTLFFSDCFCFIFHVVSPITSTTKKADTRYQVFMHILNTFHTFTHFCFIHRLQSRLFLFIAFNLILKRNLILIFFNIKNRVLEFSFLTLTKFHSFLKFSSSLWYMLYLKMVKLMYTSKIYELYTRGSQTCRRTVW